MGKLSILMFQWLGFRGNAQETMVFRRVYPQIIYRARGIWNKLCFMTHRNHGLVMNDSCKWFHDDHVYTDIQYVYIYNTIMFQFSFYCAIETLHIYKRFVHMVRGKNSPSWYSHDRTVDVDNVHSHHVATCPHPAEKPRRSSSTSAEPPGNQNWPFPNLGMWCMANKNVPKMAPKFRLALPTHVVSHRKFDQHAVKSTQHLNLRPAYNKSHLKIAPQHSEDVNDVLRAKALWRGDRWPVPAATGFWYPQVVKHWSRNIYSRAKEQENHC